MSEMKKRGNPQNNRPLAHGARSRKRRFVLYLTDDMVELAERIGVKLWPDALRPKETLVIEAVEWALRCLEADLHPDGGEALSGPTYSAATSARRGSTGCKRSSSRNG